MEKKKKLFILTGPTAVGKTKLSIQLAKSLNGEIISADSMQVYEYMDIGSAKIKKEEMQGVPHHMIDILKPWDEFNVVIFQKKCKEIMNGIYERGHVPILVGGTGFYIQSVLYDIDFAETMEDTAYREELQRLCKQNGEEYLHDLLKKIDPVSADLIHRNNIKRVIRALEYFHLTGKCISQHNEEERRKPSAYHSFYFVLNDDRKKLYANIDRRVDEMIAEGLEKEVKALLLMGCRKEMVSMQGLGYKEMISCLSGEYSMEEAIYRIKLETRHFAKRQLTWFKREKDVIWLNKPDFGYEDDKILTYMKEKIQENEINES